MSSRKGIAMPSKKPQFVIRTEKEIIEKIGYIAEENERSTTQEIVYLIKKRIREYEDQNGSINIQKNINIEDNHGTINM